MAATRLAGDRLTEILGPARLVALGAVVSALGMLAALVVAQPLVGFAAVATMGSAGAMAAPPLIGTVAGAPGCAWPWG